MSACVVCGKADADKPMIYRGTRWCGNRHREFAERTDELVRLNLSRP